jgi:hypothetical protein
MLNIEPFVTKQSTAVPGVSYTIRNLNKIEYARREAKLLEVRYRLREIVDEWMPLDKMPEEQRTAEEKKRHLLLDQEYAMLIATECKPAAIRGGLVSIEGVTIGGKPVDADLLLAAGGAGEDNVIVNKLIDEIYLDCERSAGLQVEERKNSESPITGSAPATGDESTSGAAVPAAV